MREVSCKVTRMVLEVLDEAGLGADALVEDLPTSLAELRDPGARIDWDTFTALLERLDRVCPWTPEEIGARVLRVPSFELLRRAGQLLISPKQLYEMARRLVAPALFPHVIVKHEWQRSGRLVVTGELLPGFRESIPFFRLCQGNAAALPRLLGLPASTIEEQVLTGRSARVVLLPPPSHTALARFARGARAIGSLGEAWRGVARQQVELEASLSALRNSRHELQLLIERLPDGVLIHRDGVVRWVNAALLEVYGAARLEDVVGRSVFDFTPPEDRAPLADEVRRAAANEVDMARREYRILRPDGTLRRVQAGTAQLVDFQGERARLIVLRDVTEHHRLREHAAISERLASIGALAAGVAHEINNPLAYVLLSLESASREAGELENATRLNEMLALAREGTERVIAIVRDLKMLSRVHDEPTESVDVVALLESTLALAERQIAAKARVVRRFAPTPPALGARGKLGQVFLNLLTNAADAIADGAPSEHTIRVTTRTDAAGRAVIEIADTGCGIPPEVAHRVFDAFFTTKPVGVGTGLGLAMCHRIVTELKGEIAFESAPGATTFRVTLPAAPRAATAGEAPPIARKRRGRVLVVDDEPVLLTSIMRLLRDAHEVVGAAGARQALAILDGDARFDAVLADLMMADLTGMDLYEAIRASRPGFEGRIVFMTGGAFAEREERFLAEVPNRCLGKPFESKELLEAIDAVVTSPGPARPRPSRSD